MAMEMDDAWLFPREFVESTQTGKRARLLRGKSIWFLQDVGKALSFEQVVKSTAAVFFHRFCLFHSFEQHDRFMVALACLFLASKVEERAVKLKDLIVAYYMLRMDRGPTEKEFELTKKDVILKERILLNTLNFDLTVVHPYQFCEKKVKEVKANIAENLKDLLESMYSILNDSYRSTSCLQYPPQHIALAVFYIATIQLAVVPTHPTTKAPLKKTWLDILEAEIDPAELRDIALTIIDSYDQEHFFIADRDRILSSLSSAAVHTVSTSNTPSLVVSNPVVEKHTEALAPPPAIDKTFLVVVQQVESAVNTVELSCESLSPPPSARRGSFSFEGSESVTSQATGFSGLDTPRYGSQFGDTPSWTPAAQCGRERSNSFNEYMSMDNKRHRFA